MSIHKSLIACVGGMYGVFPQYAIGFDLVITKSYNLRKIWEK